MAAGALVVPGPFLLASPSLAILVMNGSICGPTTQPFAFSMSLDFFRSFLWVPQDDKKAHLLSWLALTTPDDEGFPFLSGLSSVMIRNHWIGLSQKCLTA